ncbi:hypothetical protein ES706_03737 [subsurface metagenome]
MTRTKTSVDVERALWRIVKIRAEREEVTLMDALERILREYIKDHGEEYGYTLEQIKRRSERNR